MVFKKYIKRNGKVYGPYLYHNVKRDGRVITTYHGKHEADKEKKHFPHFLKSFTKTNKRFLFVSGFLFLLVICLIINLLFILNLVYTGKVSVDLQGIYQEGDSVKGDINLVLRNGELMPSDTKVIIDNVGEIFEYTLKEIVNQESYNGNFYLEKINILGSGEGYGIPGEKIIYPPVTFSFKIVEEKDISSISGEETPTSLEQETPVEEIPGSEVTIPDEETPIEEINPLEEIPITPTDETPVEETPTSPIEQSQENTQESTSGETSSETESSPTESSDPSASEGASSSESSSSSSESESSSGDSGTSITGEIIDENKKEKLIIGNTSKENPFTYNLKKNQKIEIVYSSHPVSVNYKEDSAIVTTDYSDVENGYGEEYLTNDLFYVPIDFSKLNLKAKEGSLKISFVYEETEILSATKEISINKEETNETNLTEANITENIIIPINVTIPINQTNLTKQQRLDAILALKKFKINPKLISELLTKDKVRVIIKGKTPIGKKIKGMKNIEAIELGIDELELLQDLDIEIIEDQQVSVLLTDSENIIRSTDAKSEFSLTGQGKKICIIDTGVDSSVVAYTNGYDFVNDDNNASDDNGHGTEVAYIAKTIAPGSEILVAKVLDENGIGYESYVLQGLQWCIDNNADIISFSIGAGNYDGFCDANIVAEFVNTAVDNGIFVAAATGNDGSENLKSPSCASKAIRVSATTKQDEIAGFANVNLMVDLFAPGENIETKTIGSSYTTSSGTSMAIPMVAGSIALLLEKENLNSDELPHRFRSTGKPIEYSEGSVTINISRIDAYNAVINNITMIPYGYSGNQSMINETNYTTLGVIRTVQEPYVWYTSNDAGEWRIDPPWIQIGSNFTIIEDVINQPRIKFYFQCAVGRTCSIRIMNSTDSCSIPTGAYSEVSSLGLGNPWLSSEWLPINPLTSGTYKFCARSQTGSYGYIDWVILNITGGICDESPYWCEESECRAGGVGLLSTWLSGTTGTNSLCCGDDPDPSENFAGNTIGGQFCCGGTSTPDDSYCSSDGGYYVVDGVRCIDEVYDINGGSWDNSANPDLLCSCGYGGQPCDGVDDTFSGNVEGICAENFCAGYWPMGIGYKTSTSQYRACFHFGGLGCDDDMSGGLWSQRGLCSNEGTLGSCVINGFLYFNQYLSHPIYGSNTVYVASSKIDGVGGRPYDSAYDSNGQTCDKNMGSGSFSNEGMVVYLGPGSYDCISEDIRIDSGGLFKPCDSSGDGCIDIISDSLTAPYGAETGICIEGQCVSGGEVCYNDEGSNYGNTCASSTCGKAPSDMDVCDRDNTGGFVAEGVCIYDNSVETCGVESDGIIMDGGSALIKGCSNGGQQCVLSVNGTTTTWTPDGVCVIGFTCNWQDVTGGSFYDVCGSSSGTDFLACDTDTRTGTGSFSQDSMCLLTGASTYDCLTTGFACKDGSSTNYYGGSARAVYCDDGSSCDLTITSGGNFQADSNRKYDSYDDVCTLCNGNLDSEGSNVCDLACGAPSVCDEQAPGTLSGTCNSVGQTYFADSCGSGGSSCALTDYTAVCNSTGTGCTASASCNGDAPGFSWPVSQTCYWCGLTSCVESSDNNVGTQTCTTCPLGYQYADTQNRCYYNIACNTGGWNDLTYDSCYDSGTVNDPGINTAKCYYSEGCNSAGAYSSCEDGQLVTSVVACDSYSNWGDGAGYCYRDSSNACYYNNVDLCAADSDGWDYYTDTCRDQGTVTGGGTSGARCYYSEGCNSAGAYSSCEDGQLVTSVVTCDSYSNWVDGAGFCYNDVANSCYYSSSDLCANNANGWDHITAGCYDPGYVVGGVCYYDSNSGSVDESNSCSASGCSGITGQSSSSISSCTAGAWSDSSVNCWNDTTCYYSTDGCVDTGVEGSDGWDYSQQVTQCEAGTDTCCTGQDIIWEGVGCTNSGATGTSYGRDTSEVRCNSTASGCTAYEWFTDSGGSCCGNNIGEEYKENTLYSIPYRACCDEVSDCAGPIGCYDNQSVYDEEYYCNNGDWDILEVSNTCNVPHPNMRLIITEDTKCSDTTIVVKSLNVSSGTFTLTDITLIVGKTFVDSGAKLIARNSKGTIWQNDNLTINGDYVLQNSTLRMNGTIDGEIGIDVNSGSMLINESSNITNGENISFNFFFIVDSGTTFNMNDSYLSEAGWAGTQGQRGLEIFTNNAVINNSGFYYCHIGVSLYGNDTVVENSIFENITVAGFYVDSDDNTIFRNSVDTNGTSGAMSIYLRPGATGNLILENKLVTQGDGMRPIVLLITEDNNVTRNVIEMYGDGSSGIQLSQGDNGNDVYYNNITAFGDGSYCIDILSSDSNNVYYNNLTAFGNQDYGIYLTSKSVDNIVVSNIISTLGANNVHPIYIDDGSNDNYFYANVLNTTRSMILLDGSPFDVTGNNFTNTIMQDLTTTSVYSTGGAYNNILLNSTFNRSKLIFGGAGDNLSIQWYFLVNVTSYNGTVLGGALVKVDDKNSVNKIFKLTDSNGLIELSTITEQIAAQTPINYNNHTLNVSKFGYRTNITSYNITESRMFNLAIDGIPTVFNVVLNSSYGTNLTNENLTVYYDTYDPDTNMTVITDWRVNGTSIAVVNMPFDLNVVGVGAIVKDYSTFSNNGTIYGNPVWEKNEKIGGGYKFDGVDDYISIDDDSSLNLTKQMTVETWIKPAIVHESDPEGDNFGVLAKALGAVSWSWQLRFGGADHGLPNNRLGFQFNNGSIPGVWVNVDQDLTTGQWYHLVGTYDGTNAKIYLNGVLKETKPLSIILGSPTPLLVGQEGWNNYFEGTIDGFLVFNRSLSSTQIYKNYQEGLAEHGLETITDEETLTSPDLIPQENWSVALTPCDSFMEGVAVFSNDLLVVNAPPVFNYVSLTPTIAYTKDDLHCTFNASDLDSPILNVSVKWYRNNVNVLNSSVINYVSGSNYTVNLSNDYTKHDLNFYCNVSVTDGFADSPFSMSNVVSILNYSTSLIIENQTGRWQNQQIWFTGNYSSGQIGDIKNLVWNSGDFDVNDNTYTVRFIDLNSDGIASDLVGGGGTSSSNEILMAYYNNGTQAWGLTNLNSFGNIETTDFEKDLLKNDLVIILGNGALRRLNIDSTTNWSILVPGAPNGYIGAIADIDGDNFKDIVLSTYGTSRSYLAYKGNSTQIWNTTGICGNSVDTAVGDFDRDGKEDDVAFMDFNLCGVSGHLGIAVFNSEGKLLFNTTDLSNSYGNAFAVQAVDLDKDGYKDEIFVGYETSSGTGYGYIRTFSWNGVYNSTYSAGNSLFNVSFPKSAGKIEAVDYDYDGYKDEFVSAIRENYISARDISGELWNVVIGGLVPYSFSVADIDDDLGEEVLVGFNNSRFMMIDSDGKIIYDRTTNLGTIAGQPILGKSNGIDTGDFNGDGIEDVAVSYSQGYFYVYQDVRCKINFNDSISANMTWNTTAGKWYYNRSFASGGIYIYNVTCLKGGYEEKVSAGQISIRVNNLPTVELLSPENNTNTFNRTVNFTWDGTDLDGDSLIYEFNITLRGGTGMCSDSRTNINNLVSESYVITPYLKCFSEDGYYYEWTVRASDDNGVSWGSWAIPWRVNISSVVSINLTTDTINFGSLLIGVNGSDSTDDNSPQPFILENDGNSLVNVSINATNLWQTVANPSNYFLYRFGSSSEAGAFDFLRSVVTYTPVPNNLAADIVLVNFNWSDSNDSARIDLNVTIPGMEEGAGPRSSLITFIAKRAE